MTRFDATGRRPVDKWITRKREFPTSPQAQQQQKRSIHVLRKAVNSKCYRHLVENYFAKIKEFRGIATRYDKTDTSYGANLNLVATLIAAR